MVTVKNVAVRLNVSLALAYRLISSGEIPSVRIASTIRVKEDDLEAYIERCRQQPPQPAARTVSLRRLKC